MNNVSEQLQGRVALNRYTQASAVMLCGALLAFAGHIYGSSIEQEVKALYLLTIPGLVLVSEGEDLWVEPTSICISASDGFETVLRALRRKQGLDSIGIYSIPVDNQVAEDRCQVLFFQDGVGAEDLRNSQLVGGDGVLTISDSPGFARDWGMIELVRHQGRVRLLVNHTLASSSEVQISSKLLEAALDVF